jgi:hypothetical protein
MPSGISQIESANVRHVPVLHFWDVGDPGGTFTQISVANFNALMDWLSAQGYAPQKLSDYCRWMRGEMDLPRKSVVLVFSGGLISQFTQAFPKLQALGFHFNLTVPGSFIQNEDQLQPAGGVFYTLANLQTMVGSGLAEVHSEGFHLEYFFQGNAASVQQLYKAAQINLKWGGMEELVESLYSYAPLIGTNHSLEPVVSTYTFSAGPRGYREGALTPTQIAAKYLVVDHLQVVGVTPAVLPAVKVYGKKHSDSSWTLLKDNWQPAWNQAFQVVTFDAAFAFKAEEIYDLKFETQSAAGAWGELVTLGSTTAQANGVETKVTSNTSSGAVLNQTLGGDVYLLESLAQETYDEVRARVLADAQRNLDFLAPYLPPSQAEVGYYYPYGTIGVSLETLWLPATLRELHPLQMTFLPWLDDRWSEIDLATGVRAVVPGGFPKRQLTCTFAVDGSRALAALESQIGSFSGALWDAAPNWDSFSTTLGWINEWSADYATELAKYSRAWKYISSTLVSFNNDGVTFPSADLAKLDAFMQKPEAQAAKVLLQIGDSSPQATTMSAILAYPSESCAALVNLLLRHAPTAAGFALNLEGANASDRPAASAWIQQLRETVDAQLPGRIIVSYIGTKTYDDQTGWSGWIDYPVWGAWSHFVFVGLYGSCDYQASIEPGPACPWQWMHDVLSYTSSVIDKARIICGFAFYGTWREGGPNWGPAQFTEFYTTLKLAYERNATWTWDATDHEWYWTSADGTAKGYQPTPQTLADRLAEWSAMGYTAFGVWAVGQGDALFYKYAEEITTTAPLLKLPSGAGQQVSDREGSSSIGQFDVEVVEDSARSLGAVMQQQELHGRKVQLRMGYAGLKAPQFPVFETFEVDRVDVGEDGTSWKLRLVDPKRSTRARIFLNATQDSPTILAGNPMDILLAVYQNELGIGQNPHLGPDAWILYDGAGPGYLQQINEHHSTYVTNPALINPNRCLDVATILAYRNGLFRNSYLEFSIPEPQDAKQWIESEIYKALGGYSVVNAHGQITPRFWLAPPLAGLAPVYAFDSRNLLTLPTSERAPIVNQVVFRLDYDGSQFQTVLFFVSGTSFSRFGLQGQQVIESKGLRAARQGILHASVLATKLFRRYDSLVPVWTIDAFHQALTVETGDIVSLTHPKVLDPLTNTRGLSNVLCEVLEKQAAYDEGKVSFKLLDVRYLAGLESSAIAGVFIPDWPGASPEQKAAFMFCASDSTGLMSDGTAGNPIYG